MKFLIEPRGDDLDTARGIINGLIIGMAMWIIIITAMGMAAAVMRMGGII